LLARKLLVGQSVTTWMIGRPTRDDEEETVRRMMRRGRDSSRTAKSADARRSNINRKRSPVGNPQIGEQAGIQGEK